MWRWFLVVAVLLSSFSVPAAKAEGQVDIAVDLLLGGIIKYNQWTQLTVTVENHGEALVGQVELGEDKKSASSGPGYRQPVQLQAGETGEYRFQLPAEFLQRLDSPTVRVMSGGTVIGSKRLLPIAYKDGNVVGVLDSNPNAFHFLTAISPDLNRPQRMSVERLSTEMLPDQSWVLKNLDMLAIGNVPEGMLNSAQLNALEEWVKRGGVLLMYAGEDGDGILSTYADDFSLKRDQKGIATDLSELRALTGQQSLPVEELPVYDKTKPLFISKPLGAGMLLFINYDVGEEPMASWQYNRELWQRVMTKHKLMERVERSARQFVVDGALLEISKNIPGVKTPQLDWVILIWGVYVALVAPVLYFVLKRMDRREWAWGILPVSAVLLTAGIYLVGRPMVVKEDVSYHVNEVRLLDEQLAEVKTAASFLTLSGGTYAVSADPQYLSVPMGGHRHGGYAVDGTVHSNAKQERLITFDHVPYLSIRQAISSGMKTGFGMFDAQLAVVGDTIKGTVINRTTFPMEELYLIVGKQRIPLGALGIGEVRQVDVELESQRISTEAMAQQREMTRLSYEERMARLKEDVLFYNSDSGIALVGLNKSAFPILQMVNRVDEQYYNLFHQQVTLVPAHNGKIVYPYGTLPVQHVRDEGGVRYNYDAWEIEKGSITFSLGVNRAPIQVTRVEIPVNEPAFRPFVKTLYHAKSGTWKPVADDQPLELATDLDEYLTADGELLIRFQNGTDTPLAMPDPIFRVEGGSDSP